jgi:hypothetical protein
MEAITTNSYKKLNNGAWGVRIIGTAKPGNIVDIITKSGKVKSETVASVLMERDGVAICTIVQRGYAAQAVAGGRGYAPTVCKYCGVAASRYNKIYRNGKCAQCYRDEQEEADMGY